MATFMNFFSPEYQRLENQYLQDAPKIITQVINSTKEEADSFGKTQALTVEDINSKAFRLARVAIPNIENALKDSFKGPIYDLLIKTTMNNISNQKKRGMVYAPKEGDLRSELKEILQKTQTSFKKADVLGATKEPQDSKMGSRNFKKMQDSNSLNLDTQTKV